MGNPTWFLRILKIHKKSPANPKDQALRPNTIQSNQSQLFGGFEVCRKGSHALSCFAYFFNLNLPALASLGSMLDSTWRVTEGGVRIIKMEI